MTERHGVRSIEGSTITITGGTGSFGSNMARHLLQQGVSRVNIFSRDETKQDDMRRRFNDERMRFFLGDVRDASSIAPAMRGADFVFHAAALKQVPSCEFFPQQAVMTNVSGSDNVIREAAAAGVETLVCLSTDKAVYPVNVMGMSKALMEKTAQAFARNFPESGMTIAVTRYGNVMHSRGSVIPLFISQLQAGRPLTVTEPRMTRFLMSLADSVELVEHAFINADPGDLFIKKAPASTVEVLARAVASLLGEDDPEIRVIGIRHGEKMHETLLSREEMVKASDEGDYFRVPLDARSLQYELYFDEGNREISRDDDYTSANTIELDIEGTKQLLLRLPEIQELLGIRAADVVVGAGQ
ncbi:MAG TPA: polysaccharide biosynthesis protein [Actinomycetaceae bacterium]|nr:polysaccharide biosynthesis protein [Actinomycetaceae bacterium]